MNLAARLKKERERLGLSQTAFGKIGEMGKTTVIAWERGSAFPNAAFLEVVAKFGADVQYIVTGKKSPSALTPDEEVLLDGYRGLDKKTRKRMLAFMLTSTDMSAAKTQVSGKNNSVVGSVNTGGGSFHM